MASTELTCLASLSARTTPRYAPSPIVLPKVRVLSTNHTPAAQSPTPEDPVLPNPPVYTKLPRKEFNPNENEVITAAIRELELDIEPKTKNTHFNLRDSTKFTRIADEQLQCQRILEKGSQDRNLGKKTSKEERKEKRTFSHPERLRTVTWPSLQYKLWIDASNLSLHRLNTTGRPGRPVGLTRSSRQSDTKQGVQRVSTSSSGKRTRNGSLNFHHKDTDLTIGYPEQWHISSSHVNRGLTPGANASRRDPMKNVDGKRSAGRVDFTRLPSRMGRSSLESFLSNSKGELLRNLQVDPLLKSQIKSSSPVTTTAVDAIAQLRDSRITALKLRGVVRNPDIGHREKVRIKKVKISTQSEGIDETRGVPSNARTGAKKLSFKIPLGSSSSNWEREVEGIEDQHKWIRGVGKGVANVDVAPPPAPLHFEDAYHIMKYVSTK